jgi:rSAM/selenodomain-associated transferase 2
MTLTDLKTSDISIIVPTLNEEQNIASLTKTLPQEVGEVIIVDGGSSDNTVNSARNLGLRVEETLPGRALQLNHGAVCAQGRILIFLHADTRLPQNFTKPVLETLSQEDVIAGAFSLAIENAGPLLRYIAFCTNVRSNFLQLPYGDQAFFLLKKQFDRIGGFPLIPIMEDFCFIRKAKLLGKIHTVKEKATTSARRWQRLGVVRTTLINQLVVLGFYLGVAPERLRSLYRR